MNGGTPYDYLFKFILIGDASVGKTCILQRYANNKFQEKYSPNIGVSYETRML
jgi:GTPase SAR1 family protein